MSIELIVPPELRGKNTKLFSSARCESTTSAKELYNLARQRLLSPGEWHKHAGRLSAEFDMFDENKIETNELAKPGWFIRIDIPGPGPKSGDGFDWVKIDLIEDARCGDLEDHIGLRVVPSINPFNPGDAESHFLERGSSSTFIVNRVAEQVFASYFGRNEKINFHPNSMLEKARNGIVGLTAFAGLSELHWKSLINGFLAKP
ncbi:MAG: hypothetical protein EOO09_04390 [Chitinophagaceae bacterium]|nr:MAG: hypothetical protein EOO09_04390 [Chitinophagaceae bacterium]